MNDWSGDVPPRQFRSDGKLAGRRESSARLTSASHKPAYRARAENSAAARSWVDRDRSPGCSASVSSQPIIVVGHVHEKRGDVDQAVDPIEDAAVAGNRDTHVLDPEVALDHANGEITQLAADADDQAGQD